MTGDGSATGGPSPTAAPLELCVYCAMPGRLLVGRGVCVCPSHRDLVRVDPTYLLRTPHGVTAAAAAATKPPQRSRIAP